MRIDVTAKDANNAVLGTYATKQPNAKWINIQVLASAIRLEVLVRDDRGNVLGNFLAVQAQPRPVNVHAFILSTGAATVSDDRANAYSKV